MKDNIALYKKAFKKWGNNLQYVVAMEEMSELTKVLAKIIRGELSVYSSWLVEEVVDVDIMMEQLKYLINSIDPDIFEVVKEKKLKRLSELLEG